MTRFAAIAATLALAAPPALANEATEAFVEANLLATLYHELGHAFIDIEGVPIFGQEEDAADVLSILLIDAFFEEEDAVALAYDTAFGFLGEAERARAVARALDTLPGFMKEVVVLRCQQQLSFAEIAQVTGAPEGTLKSRFHRAVVALRSRLGSSEVRHDE